MHHSNSRTMAPPKAHLEDERTTVFIEERGDVYHLRLNTPPLPLEPAAWAPSMQLRHDSRYARLLTKPSLSRGTADVQYNDAGASGPAEGVATVALGELESVAAAVTVPAGASLAVVAQRLALAVPWAAPAERAVWLRRGVEFPVEDTRKWSAAALLREPLGGVPRHKGWLRGQLSVRLGGSVLALNVRRPPPTDLSKSWGGDAQGKKRRGAVWSRALAAVTLGSSLIGYGMYAFRGAKIEVKLKTDK